MEDFLNLYTLTFPELLGRVALAMVLGMVLGLDREHKNKPIEFRAYMIVAVTSCIIAVLGNELYHLHAVVYKDATMDMAKIIEGTLTGIGFLGAGAIIHRGGNEVIGTATGASIWGAGGIGLAIGFGFYLIGVIAFLAIFLTLIGGEWYREKICGKPDDASKQCAEQEAESEIIGKNS
jgi:putative Mg2+ transporter-C (MgtC) family protein